MQKENEELKKQLEFSRTHKTVLDAERIKYKQALEEIREAIGKKYGMADIIKIRTILDEALNEQTQSQ